MRRIAPVFLLLAALCSGAGPGEAAARPVETGALESPVDLTGAWVMRHGDDPEWAGADLDDASWAPADIAEAWGVRHFADYAGVTWFRAELRLPWGRDDAMR